MAKYKILKEKVEYLEAALAVKTGLCEAKDKEIKKLEEALRRMNKKYQGEQARRMQLEKDLWRKDRGRPGRRKKEDDPAASWLPKEVYGEPERKSPYADTSKYINECTNTVQAVDPATNDVQYVAVDTNEGIMWATIDGDPCGEVTIGGPIDEEHDEPDKGVENIKMSHKMLSSMSDEELEKEEADEKVDEELAKAGSNIWHPFRLGGKKKKKKKKTAKEEYKAFMSHEDSVEKLESMMKKERERVKKKYNKGARSER